MNGYEKIEAEGSWTEDGTTCTYEFSPSPSREWWFEFEREASKRLHHEVGWPNVELEKTASGIVVSGGVDEDPKEVDRLVMDVVPTANHALLREARKPDPS